ncbi:MAG: DUF4956 domain-containing protein [Clostridia bacterium]|nr:DUF4956 domain-containing protein [Clostridia bacterium]MBR5383394.1 DUF4956 domain-containing protein [Clostridia bacterium]
MNNVLNQLFSVSFFEKAAAFSLPDTLLALVTAALLGLFIAALYRATYQGVMYTMTYGVTLVAVCMVSALILCVVTSNVVLTLGMVGALSIIRFRTSIKEPLDIGFMFWAVAAGIATGAGMAGVAAIGSLMIGIVVVLLMRGRQNGVPYILILNVDGQGTEEKAMALVREQVKRCRIKSKRVTKEGTEVTVDIRLKQENTDFMHTLCAMEGVASAVLVTYSGEYMT